MSNSSLSNSTSAKAASGKQAGVASKKVTPLMRQYQEVKEAYPEAILLFRVGDFYETFGEDAKLVSKELGITLTNRNNGGDQTPLAGFPHHAVDSYLPKLVKKGHKVAICDQTEDPETAKKAGKKIVSREVTEVATPGVTLSDHVLDRSRNNYVLSLYPEKASVGKTVGELRVGVAYADASTGECGVCEYSMAELPHFKQFLEPSEVILPEAWRRQSISGYDQVPTSSVGEWVFEGDASYKVVTDHFGTHSLKGFGLEPLPLAQKAMAGLLVYLQETQKSALSHIRTIRVLEPEEYMTLDDVTRLNLELTQRSATTVEEGALVKLLDRTETPFGGRLLRQWLHRPLRALAPIEQRLERVDALVEHHEVRQALRHALHGFPDIERIMTRVVLERCSPRDLGSIRTALDRIQPMLDQFSASLSQHQGLAPLQDIIDRVSPHQELNTLLDSHLEEELPAQLGDGSTFKEGVSAELDEARALSRDSKGVLAKMKQELIEQTGISSLKLGYNRVFGYYIEVTKARKEPIPDSFIRKQTLTNAERYITPELKELEERILDAEETTQRLERALFDELTRSVAAHAEVLGHTTAALAELDVVCSFAEVSFRQGYCRPEVHEGTSLNIVKGRHPVVETLLGSDEPFIPNHLTLDPASRQIMMITGPNMAGKSVILRQTGLIVLMAQLGCFVPAAEASIGLVDKIFTRVGASDNLAGGESTFLVEMNEAANILNNATPRSLILLDEIGRGTSTFDGLSIAWAMAEYLHEEPSVAAKTLFATHYHELNELAERYPRIVNANVSVKEHNGAIIFLRKLVEGGADHSYGIQVAALAGLPAPVLHRAQEILQSLETQDLSVDRAPSSKPQTEAIPPSTTLAQMALFGMDEMKGGAMGAEHPISPAEEALLDKMKALEMERLSPMDAFQLLLELKQSLGESDHRENDREEDDHEDRA